MAEDKTAEKNWYIVQTYSNYENKAKLALEQRIASSGRAEAFDEIYIPTEKVVEMKNGKRKEKERKFYKGYIFVKMLLDDETWHIVKDTPKVVGFVGGSQSKPTPVPESEVKGIADKIEEGSLKAEPQYSFQQGDIVRIVEGNFADFTGTVEEVNDEKQKLKVFVEIFGRPTSVEFDFDQVEDAE
jgi:transcriptional antiterminator NusG